MEVTMSENEKKYENVDEKLEKLEKLEEQQRRSKNVAKLWVGVLVAVIVIAAVWAAASHLM